MTLQEYINIYKFANEAYKGIGGFLNGNYIDKYPRESENKYEERKKIAYYINLFAPKVNRFVGYLFKKLPLRETNNKLIKLILDDVDFRGNNINVFMQNFAKNAKVRGVNLLLVDMPKTLPLTLKEQIENRILPYFVEILPERLIEYKLDNNGKFEYVAFSDVIDNSTFQNKDTTQVIRYYDKNEWKILDMDGSVIESGVHNLKVCPVLIFSENNEFPSIGEFSQIAFLNKRHYNLLSELDEILRNQTFSILTLKGNLNNDIEVKVSTENILIYSDERPEFIAPPPAPAEIYQKKIKQIEEAIDKIAYDVSTNQSPESGIALDIKFQGLNSSLANFATKLEDLELRAFDIVFRFLKEKNDITVSYPKNFNIIDIEKEINILNEMKNLIDSPTYFKLKTLQIIQNDLNLTDVEDFSKIVSEVEDGMKNLS